MNTSDIEDMRHRLQRLACAPASPRRDDRVAAILLECEDQELFAQVAEAARELDVAEERLIARCRRVLRQGIDSLRWRWRVYETLARTTTQAERRAGVAEDGDEAVGTRCVDPPQAQT